MGKLAHIEALGLSEVEKKHAVRAHHYQALRLAALNGKLDTIHYLESHLTPEEKKAAVMSHDHNAICWAAINGHTDTLQHLLSHLTAEEQSTAVVADCYRPIREAARNGHTEALLHLKNHLSAEAQKWVLMRDQYITLRVTAMNGHTETLTHLESLFTPEEKKEAVKACNYEAILYTAINGHITALQHLATHLTPQEQKVAAEADNYRAIQMAAYNGHTEIIQYLETPLTPQEKKTAVKTAHYAAIRYAAQNGHTETIQYLVNHLTPNKKKAAVKAVRYAAIRSAAQNGHTETLQYLLSHLTTEEQKAAIKAEQYDAIRLAATNGHTETLHYLATYLTPEEQKAAVIADNYDAIQNSAKKGHTEILQYLETLLPPEEQKAVIKAAHWEIIHTAANEGHTEIIQYLESRLTPEEKEEVVRSNHYIEAIRWAAQYGHIETLQHLLSHFTDEEKRQVIEADDYIAISWAAQCGHTETIQYLLSQLSAEEKKEAVKGDNYSGICSAAHHGHTETILQLLSHLTVEEQKLAVKANRYDALMRAVSEQQWTTIDLFLTYANALHYLENHYEEYGEEYINPYVDAELARLLATKSAFESEHPNAVFDIAQEALEPTFIMLRHLIRRNSPEDHPTIAEMLSIPRLHAALHLGYVDLDASGEQPAFMGLTETQAAENQLLRLAQDVGNTYAATALLAIPEVRRRAEAAHFYQTQQHELDLSALARDGESSMRAITPTQRHMAEAIIAQYQTRIADAGGVDVVFDALKAELAQRYEANPAILTIDDQTYALPLNYYELQNFKSAHHLTDEQYQSALTAYHQHPVHTALRYLSKPNHWMAPDANFVYVNEDRTERWSTFEEYLPTIVYFYMAAADENTPSIDGSSVADRLTLFLNQLALIGRAHNWDPIGPNDTEHDHIQHGDKPSCFSGVNKRLYQSVLNHPLLTVLTDEILNQEIRDFVRAHFQTIVANLTHEDLLTLKTDIDRLFGLTDEDMVDGATLASICQFNVPNASREEFIAKMTNKWGQQWHPFIASKVNSALTLPSEHFSTHLAKYYALANVQSLIEQREDALTNPNLQTTQPTYSHSSTTFFAAQPPSTAPANHDLNQQEDNDHGLDQTPGATH